MSLSGRLLFGGLRGGGGAVGLFWGLGGQPRKHGLCCIDVSRRARRKGLFTMA